MPTTKVSGARVTLMHLIGLGAKTTARVTFAKLASGIVRMIQETPRVTITPGSVGGTGSGRFGVSGTLSDGSTVRFPGLIHNTLERLSLVAQALPGVANLKTQYGGVGTRAEVQPGEPATGAVVEVVYPRVEAVQLASVQP